MIEAIGLIELNSIAKGIEAADIMTKAAEITLLKSASTCPGKFLILISGDVAAVNASVDAGVRIGRHYVVDQLILPNIHPQLINALTGTTQINELNAIGVIEFFSMTTAIMAADAAAKAANIELLDVRLGYAIGGKGYVTLTGDVSSVNEAVEVAASVGRKNGMLVERVVVPRPSREVFQKLL